jgi:hypothetical protein
MHYFTLYACSACILHYLFTINFIVYRLGGASASMFLQLCFLYLVASLAALLTALFLGMPTWAGIYWTVTVYP